MRKVKRYSNDLTKLFPFHNSHWALAFIGSCVSDGIFLSVKKETFAAEVVQCFAPGHLAAIFPTPIPFLGVFWIEGEINHLSRFFGHNVSRFHIKYGLWSKYSAICRLYKVKLDTISRLCKHGIGWILAGN